MQESKGGKKGHHGLDLDGPESMMTEKVRFIRLTGIN
jgi:hypothetical protein